MNHDELISKIREAHSTDQWRAFVDSISRADSATDFDVIYSHAVEPQAIGAAVYDAAKLLYESNVTCRLTCESAIDRLLPNWDISIEEVPWYLANQFGAEKILACITQALDHQVDDSARTRLKTVRYWVGLNPQMA